MLVVFFALFAFFLSEFSELLEIFLFPLPRLFNVLSMYMYMYNDILINARQKPIVHHCTMFMYNGVLVSSMHDKNQYCKTHKKCLVLKTILFCRKKTTDFGLKWIMFIWSSILFVSPHQFKPWSSFSCFLLFVHLPAVGVGGPDEEDHSGEEGEGGVEDACHGKIQLTIDYLLIILIILIAILPTIISWLSNCDLCERLWLWIRDLGLRSSGTRERRGKRGCQTRCWE